ncbi:MAG: sulfurtransferase [Proteobacteria bacterium]|nr:sulfurtransferase [Pseudomonadota bacterium]
MTDAALIDARTLSALPRDEVRVVDCRFELADPVKGEREFRQAHIPGAVYASLDRDLSDLSKENLGRHPLPDDTAFSRTLSRWGWTPGQRIVAYDDAGGAMAAARLWWLLRICGIGASVLDGGWRAWLEAGLPAGQGEATERAATRVEVRFDPAQVVYCDELERLRAQGAMLLLDARGAARYRGELEPIDPVAGHVPGARNRPFNDNLDAKGRFKSSSLLRDEFMALLAQRPPDEVVHMCGSGVTAAHNLLAMEAAGLHGSRLFAPSWSGYVSDPTRPVATGE